MGGTRVVLRGSPGDKLQLGAPTGGARGGKSKMAARERSEVIQEIHFKYKYIQSESEGTEKDIPCNGNKHFHLSGVAT